MTNNIITLTIVGILISSIFIAGCIEQPKPSISTQSIQKMINNASTGETIYISSGTYYENIIVNKSISLMGEDRTTTVINGGGGNAVLITADNCTFEGFTVINKDTIETTIGININANNTTIKNNTISSNIYGIVFNQSSKGNKVFYNNISHNTYGLYLSSSSENNILSHNIFLNNDKGIYMTQSNHNDVFMNNISNGEYGISIISSENNTISNNDIFSNTQYGIYVGIESSNNIIQLNSIFNNLLGIRIKDSYFNNVTKNIVKDNKEGVLTCCGAKNNTIYKNILKNNTDWNAEGDNNNQWDYMGFGNFWGNYTGIDNNGDGIGETPYTFIGGKDNYPLINESWIYEP